MPRFLLAFALTASLATSPVLLDHLWAFLAPVWSGSSPDIGCGWDPSGWCNPSPQPDEGCGWDPNGCPGS